jgi:hypothetical protein
MGWARRMGIRLPIAWSLDARTARAPPGSEMHRPPNAGLGLGDRVQEGSRPSHAGAPVLDPTQHDELTCSLHERQSSGRAAMARGTDAKSDTVRGAP